MTTDWKPIQFDDQPDYMRYMTVMPEPAADYTFTNLWSWADPYRLHGRIAQGLFWLRQEHDHDGTPLPHPVCWAPVGDWQAADWATMPELVPDTTFVRVPESLCTLLQDRLAGRIVVEETPEQWEYVYPRAELATLSGNRLHKKRNHVNGYLKSYGEDYRPLTLDMLPEAIALEETWRVARPDISGTLQAESTACCRVLRHWEHLSGLLGGALYIGGKMVAFCIAEKITPDMVVVHFEKALPDFRGVYQAINWCFARSMDGVCAYINREQDGGDPGLRQAKRSYQPFAQIRKYQVRITA